MKIEVLRDKFGFYEIKKLIHTNLDNLAEFFESEVGGGNIQGWIAFLRDNKRKAMKGNLMLLEKKETKVYIYYAQLDSDRLVDDDPCIINIDILIELLYSWRDFVINQVSKILLEKKGEEITMYYENRIDTI